MQLYSNNDTFSIKVCIFYIKKNFIFIIYYENLFSYKYFYLMLGTYLQMLCLALLNSMNLCLTEDHLVKNTNKIVPCEYSDKYVMPKTTIYKEIDNKS